MCTFLSVVTESKIERNFINHYATQGIFVDNISEYISERVNGLNYYLITNGHCSCGIFDSKEKIGNLLNILLNCINNGRTMLILYDDDGTFNLLKDLTIKLEISKQIQLSLNEFIKIFPDDINRDITDSKVNI